MSITDDKRIEIFGKENKLGSNKKGEKGRKVKERRSRMCRAVHAKNA